MEYLSCNENTVRRLRSQINKSVKFINIYRWIVDAYISDFFTAGHWDRLPEGWRDGLAQLDPPDLAFLLDTSIPPPKDLPLSLLAFRQCIHALSLDRRKVDLDHLISDRCLFPERTDPDKMAVISPQSDVCTQSPAKANIKYGQYLPLNSCFRVHVKPKKQHEILQMGKAIRMLGGQCRCDHVVDVGAGKGHLSRLLAFGHGFKVTTVEAVGCHAPKAQKIDRDIQRKLHRTALKRKHHKDNDGNDMGAASLQDDNGDPSNTSLPDHVTCLIQPGTSAQHFLEIVRDSYKKQTEFGDLTECEKTGTKSSGMQDVIGEGSVNLSTMSRSQASGSCNRSNSPGRNSVRRSRSPDRPCSNCDSSTDKDMSRKRLEGPDRPCSNCDSSTDKDMSRTRLAGPDICDGGVGISLMAGSPCECADLSQFILVGLHACGDLTPTMLRIFAQCPDITGLASVACCYMKMSCRDGESDTSDGDVGYPMSQFTRNITDSHLSFEAREMACHFADSYKDRLVANPPNLKLHCYRAMLQFIIRKTNPHFQHGCIKLTVKNAETLPFESYARTGLERLGLDPDIPASLIQEAESYLPYWPDVVAFYTLRLSLAPVVESLVLMDRMVFLYEQGIQSILLPIFDPALSPRNFVLLACKEDFTTQPKADTIRQHGFGNKSTDK